MFNIAKLTKEQSIFISNITSKNRELAEVALASLLSSTHNLPTVEVDDRNIYFIQNVLPALEQKLDYFNEIFTFDYKKVVDFIKSLYNARLNVAFPQRRVFNVNGVDACSLMLRYSTAVTPEIFKIIEGKNLEFALLNNGLESILYSLEEKDENGAQ